MTTPRTPDRPSVIRIIQEESYAALISADLVIGRSMAPQAIKARGRAIRRILRETGCSEMELANVWGISGSTVRYAVVRGEKPPAPIPAPAHGPYDLGTAERLAWAHGERRAAEIVAGRDAATQADIAGGRRLWNGAPA